MEDNWMGPMLARKFESGAVFFFELYEGDVKGIIELHLKLKRWIEEHEKIHYRQKYRQDAHRRFLHGMRLELWAIDSLLSGEVLEPPAAQ